MYYVPSDKFNNFYNKLCFWNYLHTNGFVMSGLPYTSDNQSSTIILPSDISI